MEAPAIVIDTSALLALVLREPDREKFAHAIRRAARRILPAVAFFEAAMVVEGKFRAEGRKLLDEMLLDLNAEVAPFGPEQAEEARAAWRKYGKGNHPAALNFGDCMVYATARLALEPLLYKGGDFAQTDIAAVL